MRLVTWALATFHASVFVLAIVLVAYTRGGLGAALGSLNTFVGLALFVALWFSTYVATSLAVRGLDLLRSTSDRARYPRRAMRWGAANGMAFVVVLGIVAIGSGLVSGAPLGSVLLPLLFVGPFALVFAAVIGAAVGVVFGAIDVGLCALAAPV